MNSWRTVWIAGRSFFFSVVVIAVVASEEDPRMLCRRACWYTEPSIPIHTPLQNTWVGRETGSDDPVLLQLLQGIDGILILLRIQGGNTWEARRTIPPKY